VRLLHQRPQLEQLSSIVRSTSSSMNMNAAPTFSSPGPSCLFLFIACWQAASLRHTSQSRSAPLANLSCCDNSPVREPISRDLPPLPRGVLEDCPSHFSAQWQSISVIIWPLILFSIYCMRPASVLSRIFLSLCSRKKVHELGKFRVP
jgi:hypothetical protein